MKNSPCKAIDVTEDKMLDAIQVLELIGCNMSTLRKQIKLGNFPEPITIAGQRRWLASTINNHVISTNPHIAIKAILPKMIDKVLDKQTEVA